MPSKINITLAPPFRAAIASHPKHSALADSFETYKLGLAMPRVFGADRIYTRPNEVALAEIWHIHLKGDTGPKWRARLDRPSTSDISLVYAQGRVKKNEYLLVAILEPAHEQQNDYELMREIARRVEKWRHDTLGESYSP